MAKSAAQRLAGTMHSVLQGFLELIEDPAARAGAGLNPDATPDSTTARVALDRIELYYNAEQTDAAQYLETVDDVITIYESLIDLIEAVRFADDATPVLEMVSYLLEIGGLNVVRNQLPFAYHTGQLLGIIKDLGTIQVVSRIDFGRFDDIFSGKSAHEFFASDALPTDQLSVDFTLGAAGLALYTLLTLIPALKRRVELAMFYGWDSLPDDATAAETLFERSLSFALNRRRAAPPASMPCTADPPELFAGALLMNVLFATRESGAISKGVLATLRLEGTFDFDVRFGTPEKVRGNVEVSVGAPFDLSLFFGQAGVESLSSLALPALRIAFKPLVDPAEESIILVGSRDDFRLEVARFSIDAEVRPLTDSVAYGVRVKAEDAALVIKPGSADGLIGKLLGGLASGGELLVSFELALGLRSGVGFYIEGGTGLRVTLALGKQLGPIRLDTLVLGFEAKTNDAGQLTIATELGAGLSFHSTGLDIVIDQMGLSWSLKPFGHMGFKPPKGVGISLALGPVSGGGYLFYDPENGQYAGAVHLAFGWLAINGVGVIQSYTAPDGSRAYAFVIILGLEFKGGIQLGFGFTLNGVGGLFGQNRGVSVEALQQGIRSGALDTILFPENPVANAPRIIASLSSVFPIQDGQTIFGPMLQLGWGGARSFITASIGLIIELESPNRFILLGKVTADFPLPSNPILHLELDCVGVFNPSTGESSFDATLYRSKIGPYTITGDIVWRSIGGSSPFWILAIGGINPHFVPPPGVLPPMTRVGINLVSGDNPRAYLSGYTALSSNTFQIGGAVDASYSKAGFTLSAHIGADALINTATFAFIVDFDLSVAIKRGRTNIASIGLSGTITGPKPFRFDGTAKLGLFLFSIRFHVSFTIGSDRPAPLPSLSVSVPLLAALNDPRNWSGALPDGEAMPLSVTRATLPTGDPAADLIIHPLGELTVRERVAPLAFSIERYSAGTVEGDNHFILDAVALGGEAAGAARPVSDLFPVGDFLNLSDHERLSRPSFESLESGLTFAASGVLAGEKLETSLAYKTIIRKKAQKPLTLGHLHTPSVDKFLVAVRQGAAAQSVLRQAGLQRFRGPASQRVALGDPAFTIASTVDLKQAAALPSGVRQGTTYAQAAQALAALRTSSGTRAFQIVLLSEVAEP